MIRGRKWMKEKKGAWMEEEEEKDEKRSGLYL